jgi:predicted  nucleic acid-binding Zn-ribbon protein
MLAQLSVLKTTLLKARNFYATASERERNQLRKEIMDSEQQQEMLEGSISRLEKEIRNTEN